MRREEERPSATEAMGEARRSGRRTPAVAACVVSLRQTAIFSALRRSALEDGFQCLFVAVHERVICVRRLEPQRRCPEHEGRVRTTEASGLEAGRIGVQARHRSSAPAGFSRTVRLAYPKAEGRDLPYQGPRLPSSPGSRKCWTRRMVGRPILDERDACSLRKSDLDPLEAHVLGCSTGGERPRCRPLTRLLPSTPQPRRRAF